MVNEVRMVKEITKMYGVDRGIRLAQLLFCFDGGEGSGNFNHGGRPGQVGGSAPSKGGGAGSSGGGEELKHSPHMQASPEYQKKLDEEMAKFPKLSHGAKVMKLTSRGILPTFVMWKDEKWFKENDKQWKMNMRDAGYPVTDDMDFETASQYAMARYTVMEKYTNAHGERKYPLKMDEGCRSYLKSHQQRLKAVQYFTGVDKEEAEKMLEGLENHCGDAFADCEWVDKYIDANGRYKGKIYRWKGYTGKEAQEKMASLFPGAKMENPHDSNWSFSSEPFATSVFGSLGHDDYTTFCFVCDENITAAPISQYSVYEDEFEVVPHSKTTYTVQSITQKEHEGMKYWEVKISEDDWQAKKNIKPYDPPRVANKHDDQFDYWNP